MSGFNVSSVQGMHELEAGNQHVFQPKHETSYLINSFGGRLRRAIRDGANRLWRWCSSLLTPSGRGHQLRQMDRQMLLLFQKEQSLKDTLRKTEEAMQFKPVHQWNGKGLGTMEYLQTVKTHAAIELQRVNDRRITTLNQKTLAADL